MAASNLLPRSDGSPRSAYAKVCLLPDTSEKSKRRTKTIMNSTDPKWNQNFSFTTMRRSDLKFKVLQISLWDYDNNPTNQFLGEVLIELGLKKLENLAEWYPLTAHQEITVCYYLSKSIHINILYCKIKFLGRRWCFNR